MQMSKKFLKMQVYAALCPQNVCFESHTDLKKLDTTLKKCDVA